MKKQIAVLLALGLATHSFAATLSRLHSGDIQNGKPVNASHLNNEFNQLVNESNSKETRITNLESGSVTISGNKTFSGTNSHSGANTFSSTVLFTGVPTFSNNVNVTGDLNLARSTDPTVSNGDIWYNSTSNLLKARIAGSTVTLGSVTNPIGYIYDLTMANNGTDAANDIDFATGSATDDTGVKILTLVSAMTKRTDAAFTAGTNNGCMDTGSKPTSGTLHLYIIGKSAASDIDFVCSTSASSPTMPSGFDLRRRIGAVLTDVSGNIIAFYQNGDEFLVKSPTLDVNATDGTTATLQTLTVPNGIRVKAILSAYITNAAAVAGTYLSSPDQTDLAPSESAAPLVNIYGDDNSGARQGASQVQVWTNTSRQIRSRSLNASTTLRISTFGWVDTRGRK